LRTFSKNSIQIQTSAKEPIVPVLVIQHAVGDYEGWKRSFDADPLGRAKNGVVRHVVYRSASAPTQIVIHLEFGSSEQAQAFLQKLQEMWRRVGDRIGFGGAEGVRTMIIDEVERVDY
jgi:hypothetical protein